MPSPNRATRRAAPRPAAKTVAPADGEVMYFGPSRDAAEIDPIPFAVGFIRNGVLERHEFTARPRASYSTSVALVDTKDEGRAIAAVASALRRFLIDDDGTPANWRPGIVGRTFTDPDGEQRPIGDLPQVTAHETGSSRRRWNELTAVDATDVELELGQAIAAFEWLTGQAAEFAASQAEQTAS